MFLKQISPPDLANQSDENLLHQFQKTGDPRFFSELFGRHVHLVYFMSYRYLSDNEDRRDLVMRVFEKVLMELPRRSQVRSFNQWLFALARNECLNWQRSCTRNDHFQQNLAKNTDWMLEYELPPPHSEGCGERDYTLTVEKLMPLLEEEQYRCIYLFFFEAKSYKEIARETGFQPKQVKSYLQNGKRRLKHMLLKKADKNYESNT